MEKLKYIIKFADVIGRNVKDKKMEEHSFVFKSHRSQKIEKIIK